MLKTKIALVCVISLMVACSSPSLGGDKAQACQIALEGCQTLVKAQDAQIALLKRHEEILKDAAVKARAEGRTPWYMFVAIGLVGVAAGTLITR